MYDNGEQRVMPVCVCVCVLGCTLHAGCTQALLPLCPGFSAVLITCLPACLGAELRPSSVLALTFVEELKLHDLQFTGAGRMQSSECLPFEMC